MEKGEIREEKLVCEESNNIHANLLHEIRHRAPRLLTGSAVSAHPEGDPSTGLIR